VVPTLEGYGIPFRAYILPRSRRPRIAPTCPVTREPYFRMDRSPVTRSSRRIGSAFVATVDPADATA